ncbi:hypothetical protein [Paraburkholderia strydomiana]|uniref:hypothetical protein n=1 Tax=Paraburkholderia strydomiana TaxID=1245417 RepID=UPI0038B75DBC
MFTDRTTIATLHLAAPPPVAVLASRSPPFENCASIPPKAANKKSQLDSWLFFHDINTPSKDVSNSNVRLGFKAAHMVTLGFRW